MNPDAPTGAAGGDQPAALVVPGGPPAGAASGDAGAPGHALGAEWVRGADGLLFRRGARVILLDEDDRVLLIRGHDADQPERSWWFTIGGGIDAGESPVDAAIREVREESGIVLAPDDVMGPVLTRSAVFDFAREHCRQDEEIFLARVPSSSFVAEDRSGWTPLEQDVIDELRWWVLEDLASVEIEVFPEGLVDLVRALLPVWDGQVRHLGLAHE
ncbi:NUDIX domain-containing protein [Cellulomonas sp. DKR-3]|uniref:NUDIX domain-containing protein n=1 Tax=Cellulomonas fulva TaxID=2835530 RepID=A0ABS5U0R9_9CELL|nr:NUDIX domain-containing protein [Cellulomonas fulva]MBT0994999.1 NUDIX domain-containing protein [Cellulomonas fulva]